MGPKSPIKCVNVGREKREDEENPLLQLTKSDGMNRRARGGEESRSGEEDFHEVVRAFCH